MDPINIDPFKINIEFRRFFFKKENIYAGIKRSGYMPPTERTFHH
jgi:hypothetical protein